MNKKIGLIALCGVSLGVAAQSEKHVMKLGAQLYDNWPVVTQQDAPSETHPLYPEQSKKKGAATWRCKECHGWDYIGKDGRYSSGSHFTGIKGIFHTRRESSEKLFGALSNRSKHNFSKFLNEKQLQSLVLFIQKGMIDITQVVKEDKGITGNTEQGRKLYYKNCNNCHWSDGDMIDFKPTKDGVQGVGWAANDNPQETLHKIRWGHPGSNMPSGIADSHLSDQDAIDILKFTQSLGK